MREGRIWSQGLLCLCLAVAGCTEAPDVDGTAEVSSMLSPGAFPTTDDTWSGAPAARRADTALAGEVGLGLDANRRVGPESQDTSPYECEPLTVEECVTACGTYGTRKCLKEWGPCVVPEVCNGIDDDCNGIIDDGPDGPPTEEVCDGLDNDCDGEIDEELFQPCTCQGIVVSQVACVNGEYPSCPEPQPATELVEIPYLDPNCPFGQADNLGWVGGAVAARVEQEVPFTFPEDRVICSIALSGASDDFYYDDHIILTLNDVVLISSLDILGNFEVQNGLPIYSWDAIVGSSAGGASHVCLPGATVCQMPGTQQNGQVSLAFDEQTSDLLVQTGQGLSHKFTAIVTGDDNPDVDCHHNGLTIAVEYTYLLKP